ncbi:DUF3592 domain-containing protein [Streptomyces coeruleorubidus]|uniref:DUF3592 domain-containing protein n=1 Tax=Streptomyces coeruleorubidus TaxID=116188 RepID=UPI0036F4F673
MGAPAIPIAVIAAFVFAFSAVAYKRGRALRTRGIRTSAKCVNSRKDGDGKVYLLVQFPSKTGATLQTSVGPFVWPPASVGGAIEVVYDPKDASNTVTPDEVTSGRTLLAFAIGSGVLLFLCFAVMLIDFAG